MVRQFILALAALLASQAACADDRITREAILETMAASDAAARVRDAAAVGLYLGNNFERVIEWPHKDLMATVRLGKMDYLLMIDEGWINIQDYEYQRDDIVVYVETDGNRGRSNSTLTEHMVIDGVHMTSRFREYATYEIENGRPVITSVSGHRLLGDTTPE